MVETRKEPDMAEEKTIYNQTEAAAYISDNYKQMDGSTLSKLTNSGGGPSFQRLGYVKMFRKWELDRWITEQKERDAGSASA
jgi:hypothetical protein